MPPTRALKPELVEIFERWVLGEAPNTAEEAAALSPEPVEAAVEEAVETPAEEPAAAP
jgi:hypothetical protein